MSKDESGFAERYGKIITRRIKLSHDDVKALSAGLSVYKAEGLNVMGEKIWTQLSPPKAKA